MFGLDYVSGPAIADLQAAGVSFVCRYLSEVNALTQVKLLTKAEAEALSQAGISIVSNYEWYAERPLGGDVAGVADAKIAEAQHAACGGPVDRPIYFSVDFDMTANEETAVASYFKGVASAIGKERTGAYGSYGALKYLFDNGLIAWGWQTYAWSNGQWESRAHLQQYQNGVILVGKSVDYNRAMTEDFGQWRIGEDMVQPLKITDPAVSALFEDVSPSPDHPAWKSKATGRVMHDALLKDYIANGQHSLDYLGDVLSPEYDLPNGTAVQIHASGARVWTKATGKVGAFDLFGPDGQPMLRKLLAVPAPAPVSPQATALITEFVDAAAQLGIKAK